MANYDEKIMAELINQPDVKEQTCKMHPDTLAWFKEILVREGVYARYVKERQRKPKPHQPQPGTAAPSEDDAE